MAYQFCSADTTTLRIGVRRVRWLSQTFAHIRHCKISSFNVKGNDKNQEGLVKCKHVRKLQESFLSKYFIFLHNFPFYMPYLVCEKRIIPGKRQGEINLEINKRIEIIFNSMAE